MLDMRWKLLLTPVCRDGPDSMVLKNTRRSSDFSHTFVQVLETLSVCRKGVCQAASSFLWCSWILVKWKIIVCLPEGKPNLVDVKIKSAAWAMVIWLLATEKVWKHP